MTQSPISPQMAANLFVFELVARRQSFTEAASELNLTQSAVSQRIARLEKAFDGLLLTRCAGTLKLTPAGQEIYSVMSPLCNRLYEIFADNTRDATQPALTVSCCPSIVKEWLEPTSLTSL